MKEFFAKLNFWKLSAVFFGIWLLLVIIFWGRVSVDAALLDDYVLYYDWYSGDLLKINYFAPAGDTTMNCENVFCPDFGLYTVAQTSSDNVTWTNVNPYQISIDDSFLVSGLYLPSEDVDDHLDYFSLCGWCPNMDSIAISSIESSSSDEFQAYFWSSNNQLVCVRSNLIHSYAYVKNRDNNGIYDYYYFLPYYHEDVTLVGSYSDPDVQYLKYYVWSGGSWTYIGNSYWGNTTISDSYPIVQLLSVDGLVKFGNFCYQTLYGVDVYTDNYGEISTQDYGKGTFYFPPMAFNSTKFEGSYNIDTGGSTPTPTPDPEIQSIICKDTSGYYFMFDFYVSDFGSSISFDLNDNNALTSAMSTYNLSNSWVNSASWQMYWSGSGNYRSHVFVYFSGSVSEIYMYEIGSSLVSSDFDYIRNNFEGTLVSDSTSNVFYGSSDGLFGFDFAPYKGYYSSNPTELIASSFSYKTRAYVSEGYNFPNLTLFSKDNIGLTFPLYCAYTLGLEGSSGESAGPSPTFTPTPSPTPTPAPYVNIQWPTSTPTPTPFAVIDVNIPTMPLGDLSGEVTENYLDNTIRIVDTNGQFGLLAKAFSFIPNELQYLIWLLIFILLILAVIKMIIHFGG